MEMSFRKLKATLLCVGGVIVLSGCGGLKPQEDPYQASWQERMDSEDWKESLTVSKNLGEPGHKPHYALPDLDQIRAEDVSPEFMKAYPKLVSRAYFRLIAEAMEADRKIRAEYQNASMAVSKKENAGDPIIEAKFETAKRRYQAHRQMLEGLRSWRAFQKFGSDDLEFFLEEQLRASFALFQKGATEERIVGHLMTGLADLYHKEEGTSLRSL